MPLQKNVAIIEVERKCPENQNIMEAKSKSISDSSKIPKKKKKLIVKLPIKKKKTKTVLNKNLAQELNLQLANEVANYQLSSWRKNINSMVCLPDEYMEKIIKNTPKKRTLKSSTSYGSNTTSQPTGPVKGGKKKLIIRIKEGVRGRPSKKTVCSKKNSFNINNATEISSPSRTCTETAHLDNSEIIQESLLTVAEPRKKRSYKKRAVTNKTLSDPDNVAAEPRKKRAYRKKNARNSPSTPSDVGITTPETIICTPDTKVASDMEQSARKDNGQQEAGALLPEPRKKITFSKKVKSSVATDTTTETNSRDPNESGSDVQRKRVGRKRRVSDDTLPVNNCNSQLDCPAQAPIEVTPKPPRKRLYRKKVDRSTHSTENKTKPEPEEKTLQPEGNTPGTLFNLAGLSDTASCSSNPPPADVKKTDLKIVEDIFKKVEETLGSVAKKIKLTRPKPVLSSETKLQTSIVKSNSNKQATDTKLHNPSPRIDVIHETDLNNCDKTKDNSLSSKTSNQSLPSPTSKDLKSSSPKKSSNTKCNSETETTNTPNSINWSRTNSSTLSLNKIKDVENVCINGLMPKVLVIDFKKEIERRESRSNSRSSTLSNLTVASLSSSLREGAKNLEKVISRPSSILSCVNESIVNSRCLSPAISEPPVSVLHKDLEISSMSSSSTCTTSSCVRSSRSHSSRSISKKTLSPTKTYAGKSSSYSESDSEFSARLMLRRTRSSTSSVSDSIIEPRPTILSSNSVLSMASTDTIPKRISGSPQRLKFNEPVRANPLDCKQSSKQLTQSGNKLLKQPTLTPNQLPIHKTLPCYQSPKQPTLSKNQLPEQPTVTCNQSPKQLGVVCNQSPKQSTELCQSPKVPRSVRSQSPNNLMPSCNQSSKPNPSHAIPSNQNNLNKKLQNILDINFDELLLDDDIDTVVDEDKTDVPCPEKDILTICSSFKAIPETSNNQTLQSNENTMDQKTVGYITLEDIKQMNARNDNLVDILKQSCGLAENRLSTDVSKSYDDDGACSDNDDVLSIYAGSLNMFDTDEGDLKPELSKLSPPITPVNQVLRTPTNRHNYFRPVPPEWAPHNPMNKDNEKTKTICEKQRADSTSVVINENKTSTDTDSESNYNIQAITNKPNITENKQPNANQTQNIQRNNNVNTTNNSSGTSLNNHFETLANQYYTSNLDKLPNGCAVPSSLLPASCPQTLPLWMAKVYGPYETSCKFWHKKCIFFIRGCCSKGEACEYEHVDISSEELECWLANVSEKVLAHQYIRIRKWHLLRIKYLKSFVSEAIRRDLPRMLVEILYDITSNKMMKTPPHIVSEVTETILLYFNNKSLNTCIDFLVYGEKGKTLCEYMLKSIITSQNFSRYKEIFVKLTNFIIKSLRSFDAQDTMQFLERISLLPFDSKVARALVKMMKHSDASVMRHKSIDMFEKLISRDETIYNEYIEFKGKMLGFNSSVPNPATTSTSNAIPFEGKTNTSPDTTNNDVMRNNIAAPNLSPVRTPISSTAETFKSCDSLLQQYPRHFQTEFKIPLLPSLLRVDTRPYRPNYRNYVNHYRPRDPRPPFRPTFLRRSHHQFDAINPMGRRGFRPGT